jgi:hypothetical protein
MTLSGDAAAAVRASAMPKGALSLGVEWVADTCALLWRWRRAEIGNEDSRMVRRPTKIFLFALSSLLTALGGRALGAEEPSWTVGELVVTARPQGPVLWRVAKGGSEVWVLGVLPNMPRHQAWNTARLERVITGAGVVLTQPRASVDLFTVLGVLTHLNLPRGRTLDQELPPDLETRFVHARALAGTSAARYARLKPVWAAWRLLADYYNAAKVSYTEPQDTVVRLASRHHTPVRPVATYRAKPILRNFEAMTDAEGQACLADAVTDIEHDSRHAAAAAEAWAAGDLRAVREHYADPAFRLCLEAAPSFVALRDRSVADTVDAVDAALARPGKSVAIFSLDDLLSDRGALQRLRAEGATITAPRS